MCVLVNENTYSAAEFFAAAIQEYEWGSVVGMQTTGKARSQITVELSDGSAVHISTNKYLTPNRVDLAEAGGVVPDYVVSNEIKETPKPEKTDNESGEGTGNEDGAENTGEEAKEKNQEEEEKILDPQLEKAIAVLG